MQIKLGLFKRYCPCLLAETFCCSPQLLRSCLYITVISRTKNRITSETRDRDCLARATAFSQYSFDLNQLINNSEYNEWLYLSNRLNYFVWENWFETYKKKCIVLESNDYWISIIIMKFLLNFLILFRLILLILRSIDN